MDFGHNRLVWLSVCRGIWSPGEPSMFGDLPMAVQEEISINDIYPTLIQVNHHTAAGIHVHIPYTSDIFLGSETKKC